MNQIYSDKSKCCGCGACVAACPKNAIYMENDIGGSPYPVIDTEICIDCKRCVEVCQYHQQISHSQVIRSYALQNIDESQLNRSSSGGAFSALSAQFLADGGIVCGAVEFLDIESIKVEHRLIEHIEDLPFVQGSKYVQSDLTKVFRIMREALSVGKKILFSGTPCQVAAVRSLFKKYEEQLFCVDLICHGTPGQKLFTDYLNYLGDKNGGKVIKYTFRDKELGWNALQGHCLVEKADGSTYRLSTTRNDSYYGLFMDGEIYRDSCYVCPYAEPNRIGDITVGDYWGIDKQNPELLTVNGGPFEKQKGISCLLVNTDKGEKLLQRAKERLLIKEVALEGVMARNTQLRCPATHTKVRDTVISAYGAKGYDGVEHVYKSYYIRKKSKNAIKIILIKIKRLLGIK